MTSEPPLRDTYGEIILKKDTVLYHTSQRLFNTFENSPMLFIHFHPSDRFIHRDSYITRLRLNKDICLLFMLRSINEHLGLFSALQNLIKRPAQINNGRHPKNLIYINKYLKAENFDGWLTPYDIFDVEVGLINDPDVFSVISSTNEYDYDWRRSNFSTTNFRPKYWGINYPVTIKEFPVQMNIHIYYKEMIERFIETGKNEEFEGTTILIMFNHAQINYRDSVRVAIIWDCNDADWTDSVDTD